jgi:hypothetical protein
VVRNWVEGEDLIDSIHSMIETVSAELILEEGVLGVDFDVGVDNRT